MNEKFQNKYRVSSTRLQNWDYRWNGAYFVTICTQNRENYFGEIVNGVMQLSSIGIIADILWYEIKNHANDIGLDAFVVMPNHIHGILIKTNANVGDIGQPPQPFISIGHQRFQNIGKDSISSIIGSYKSAVTKHACRLGYDFAWQSRFYDHIIRDDKSFLKIQSYIVENPLKWKDDKFYDK